MNRKKLVFVNLEQGHFKKGLLFKVNRLWTPYEIAIMAAMQREKGHEVVVLDANAFRWDNRKTAQKIIDENPDLLLFASQPTDRWQNPYPSIDRQRDFVRTIRKSGYTKTILAFGPHPTLMPEVFLKEIPECDFIIRGEPESGVDAFIRAFFEDKQLDAVSGLSALANGEPKHYADEKFIPDLNTLPMPAYDLLPMDRYQFHFYSQIADPAHRFAFIETNRGCPFACSFCNLTLYGRKVRRFSVERMLKEIDLLVDKYKVNYIFFGDLSFGIHKRDTEQLLKGLIERNYPLRWSCQTRADIVDDKFMSLMSKAGCHRIEAGIETADPGLLEEVKRIKVKRLQQFVQDLARHEIKLEPGHLIGLPGQTAENVLNSARILRDIGVRFKVTSVTIPYPGTVDFEKGVREGSVDGRDWQTVLASAGKSGNNFSDGQIKQLIWRVQFMYYRHIFFHGAAKVLTNAKSLKSAFRGTIQLPWRPREGAGAIKRTFEDVVYGAE